MPEATFSANLVIGALSLACALIIAAALLVLVSQRREVIIRINIILFALSFTTGFLLYSHGFATLMGDPSAPASYLVAALRGITSTAAMYSMQNEYSSLVAEGANLWLAENLLVQCVFWGAHVIAVVVSLFTLITLFGRRLLDEVALRFRFFPERYFISGDTARALVLGANIATHDGALTKPDPKRLIVLLGEGDTSSARKAAEKFGGILVDVEHNELVKRLAQVGFGDGRALRLSAMKKADRSLLARVSREPNLCAEMLGGAGRIARPATGRSRRAVKQRLIMVSPDESVTLTHLTKLACYLSSRPALALPPDIIVRSSSPWVEREADELSRTASNLDPVPFVLSTFDEAGMAARMFINRFPPYRLLEFSAGVAKRGLSVLIVGFGALGKEMLLALARNAQFVNGRPRFLVVDRHADALREGFEQDFPSFGHCADVEFLQMDAERSEFFGMLRTRLSDFDCVVATVGKGAQGLRIAHRVRELSTQNDDGPLFLAVSLLDGALDRTDNGKKVVFFARQSEIYSDSAIIHDEIDRLAKAVNLSYELLYAPELTASAESLWMKIPVFLRNSNRAVADFIPTYLHLAGVTESEAIENRSLVGRLDTPELLDYALLETLAETEHLRWNAFHVTHGYSPMGSAEMEARHRALQAEGLATGKFHKDDARRRHACLVEYDELEELDRVCAAIRGHTERPFKENDRDTVRYLPFFMVCAKGAEGVEGVEGYLRTLKGLLRE
jgi:hypothetical protein